ncbi:hypothetical protein B0H14DRAFT_3722846 [Mycena olivaceomarginata]|nr:hypothetical protein B0H14DRAFT_3722846 [Mycena olivaceomarginata]
MQGGRVNRDEAALIERGTRKAQNVVGGVSAAVPAHSRFRHLHTHLSRSRAARHQEAEPTSLGEGWCILGAFHEAGVEKRCSETRRCGRARPKSRRNFLQPNAIVLSTTQGNANPTPATPAGSSKLHPSLPLKPMTRVSSSSSSTKTLSLFIDVSSTTYALYPKRSLSLSLPPTLRILVSRLSFIPESGPSSPTAATPPPDLESASPLSNIPRTMPSTPEYPHPLPLRPLSTTLLVRIPAPSIASTPSLHNLQTTAARDIYGYNYDKWSKQETCVDTIWNRDERNSRLERGAVAFQRGEHGVNGPQDETGNLDSAQSLSAPTKTVIPFSTSVRNAVVRDLSSSSYNGKASTRNDLRIENSSSPMHRDVSACNKGALTAQSHNARFCSCGEEQLS